MSIKGDMMEDFIKTATFFEVERDNARALYVDRIIDKNEFNDIMDLIDSEEEQWDSYDKWIM